MLLSTQTHILGCRHGDEQAVRLLAEAGFDAYDFSFFQMSIHPEDYEMCGPGFREYAARIRAVSEQSGIVCNQAHAPFPSSTGDPEEDEKIFRSIVRSMEAASLLGAKVIIVHPLKHLPYATDAERLFTLNMDFYRRLIPYCQQFQIQVACENMWELNSKTNRIINSVCSQPEEFRRYLDELNSPWIVACLDVGHTALTSESLSHCIRTLGKKHLQSLHVHDNDLIQDSHTLPFTLNIDFQELTSALAEIGYEGDFTFEADMFLQKLPVELEKDVLRFMCKVGRYLVSQIER